MLALLRDTRTYLYAPTELLRGEVVVEERRRKGVGVLYVPPACRMTNTFSFLFYVLPFR